jgi:hypothetical protein
MTSNLPQREAVARHLREWCRSFIGVRITAKEANESTDAILQIISSLQDRWRPPEGWKLVPVEPTSEMWASALACEHRRDWVLIAEDVWKAMLKAAPIPSSLKGSDVGEVGE